LPAEIRQVASGSVRLCRLVRLGLKLSTTSRPLVCCVVDCKTQTLDRAASRGVVGVPVGRGKGKFVLLKLAPQAIQTCPTSTMTNVLNLISRDLNISRCSLGISRTQPTSCSPHGLVHKGPIYRKYQIRPCPNQSTSLYRDWNKKKMLRGIFFAFIRISNCPTLISPSLPEHNAISFLEEKIRNLFGGNKPKTISKKKILSSFFVTFVRVIGNSDKFANLPLLPKVDNRVS